MSLPAAQDCSPRRYAISNFGREKFVVRPLSAFQRLAFGRAVGRFAAALFQRPEGRCSLRGRAALDLSGSAVQTVCIPPFRCGRMGHPGRDGRNKGEKQIPFGYDKTKLAGLAVYIPPFRCAEGWGTRAVMAATRARSRFLSGMTKQNWRDWPFTSHPSDARKDGAPGFAAALFQRPEGRCSLRGRAALDSRQRSIVNSKLR
jgi:hypothetical protein